MKQTLPIYLFHWCLLLFLLLLMTSALSVKGLGATLNVAKPWKGSSVAIFGLGAVGLAVSFSSLMEAAHSFALYYCY